jgi:hypothetical protein
MKTKRVFLWRLLALGGFSALTAWLFHSHRVQSPANTHPPERNPALTKFFANRDEIKTLMGQLHERNLPAAERMRIRKRLDALMSDLPVDFTSTAIPPRIPAGATDPDSVWRSQMQNARATLKELPR